MLTSQIFEREASTSEIMNAFDFYSVCGFPSLVHEDDATELKALALHITSGQARHRRALALVASPAGGSRHARVTNRFHPNRLLPRP